MAYKVIILYQLYMPSYFLGTFTEYPYLYIEKLNKREFQDIAQSNTSTYCQEIKRTSPKKKHL